LRSVEDLTHKGFIAHAVKTDVSLEEDVVHLIEETVQTYGGIDILVNNAGIFPFKNIKDMSSEDFDKVITTNLRGVFLMIKYGSCEMIKQGRGGKIINITSIDALHPSMTGLAHYDASKHGVWGFTKNAALELAEHNTWVNAVAPGSVTTHGTAVAQSQGQDVAVERYPEYQKADVPMGRAGIPDDIGKAVLFLASDLASYMTGSQIVVDGGYLLK
jgi:2-deoxy-D-gluconate 3-dehydrogenase